jgi:hypothetical protein
MDVTRHVCHSKNFADGFYHANVSADFYNLSVSRPNVSAGLCRYPPAAPHGAVRIFVPRNTPASTNVYNIYRIIFQVDIDHMVRWPSWLWRQVKVLP